MQDINESINFQFILANNIQENTEEPILKLITSNLMTTNIWNSVLWLGCSEIGLIYYSGFYTFSFLSVTHWLMFDKTLWCDSEAVIVSGSNTILPLNLNFFPLPLISWDGLCELDISTLVNENNYYKQVVTGCYLNDLNPSWASGHKSVQMIWYTWKKKMF